MLKSAIAAAIAAITMVGCASQRHVDQTDVNAAIVARKLADAQRAMDAQNPPKPAVERVGDIWLGKPRVLVESSDKLPAKLNADITLKRGGRHSLTAVAEQINRETGIPVRVQPDVFVPSQSLMPGNSTSAPPPAPAAATAPAATAFRPVPPPIGTNPLASLTDNFDSTLSLNFSGPLEDLLNLISARLGISWKYEGGSIVLYRFVTKSFTFRGLPGTANMNVSLGRGAQTTTGNAGSGGAGGSNGSFESSNTSSASVKSDVWTNMLDQINVIKTPLGKVAGAPSTGTITVTDTKAAVDQIEKLINDENIKVLRSVRIAVEVYSVTVNDAAERGFDLNTVFKSVANGNSNFRFNAVSPTSLVSSLVGTFTSTIEGGAGGNRPLSGTSAVVSAMAQYGKVASIQRTVRTAGNNQPSTFAITTQTGYIASTTPATATAGGTGGVPGLTPGTVTTGFFLNMVPSIIDTKRLELSFALDISQPPNIVNFTSGSGATAQTVQTPEVSSFQVLDRNPVKLGETLVFNLFERDLSQYTKRGVSDSGTTSFTGRNTKEVYVMFLTPVMIYERP